MGRRVLIALDLGNLSKYKKALNELHDYLKKDDELIILTVIENVSSGYVSSFLSKDASHVMEAEAKKDLEAFSQKYLSNFDTKKHIVGHGNVYETVLEISTKTEADLIVALERETKLTTSHNVPIFGPNSLQIVRFAHCSVLILR